MQPKFSLILRLIHSLKLRIDGTMQPRRSIQVSGIERSSGRLAIGRKPVMDAILETAYASLHMMAGQIHEGL